MPSWFSKMKLAWVSTSVKSEEGHWRIHKLQRDSSVFWQHSASMFWSVSCDSPVPNKTTNQHVAQVLQEKKNQTYSGSYTQNLMLPVFASKSTVERFIVFLYHLLWRSFSGAVFFIRNERNKLWTFNVRVLQKVSFLSQEFCLFYGATNKVDSYLPSSFHADQLLNICGAFSVLYLTCFFWELSKETYPVF